MLASILDLRLSSNTWLIAFEAWLPLWARLPRTDLFPNAEEQGLQLHSLFQSYIPIFFRPEVFSLAQSTREIFQLMHRIHATEFYHVSVILSKPIFLVMARQIHSIQCRERRKEPPLLCSRVSVLLLLLPQNAFEQVKLSSISALCFWKNTTIPYQFRLSNFSCSGVAGLL